MIQPILGFLSVLKLDRSMRQRDGQTNTGHHFIIPLPTEIGGIIQIPVNL